VDVHSLGHLRVGLSSDQPTRVLELVAAVVDGRDVHRQDVFTSTFKTADLHFERREHPSVRTTRYNQSIQSVNSNIAQRYRKVSNALKRYVNI